jgi:YihY family inner membrane protein
LARVARAAKKFVDVLPVAVQRFYSDRCPQQAAGISYRVLFSIAPLAIVLVSVFGLVLQNDSFRHDVVNAIVDELPVTPAGKKDVENALNAIATPASAAGLVSLLVFAWAATGMMTSLRQGLESAMHVTQPRPLIRAKLVDLTLIVGTGVLVLVTVLITVLGNFAQRAADRAGEVPGLGAGTLVRLASFGLAIVVVLLVYRFVPARGLRIRDGVVGATVTALLLQLISFASGFIYDKTTNLSAIYGSLTAALVFLYSTYLAASALLLGAETAAVWSRPPSGPGEPILTQVKRGVLGLFVEQQPSPAKASPTRVADDETRARRVESPRAPTKGDTMPDQSARKLLAASFATPEGGSRAAGAIGGALPDRIGNSAVLFVKPDGKAKFVESKDWGAGRGALLGGAIGILGGPLGILAGGSIGALAAKLRDSGFKNDQLEQLGHSLGPNTSAVVIEISSDALDTAKRLLEALEAKEVVVEDVDAGVATLFDDESEPAPEPEPAATVPSG